MRQIFLDDLKKSKVPPYNYKKKQYNENSSIEFLKNCFPKKNVWPK